MTHSMFPTRHLLGKISQDHQDRWQLQEENRSIGSQTSGNMPIMQFIQVCAARW